MNRATIAKVDGPQPWERRHAGHPFQRYALLEDARAYLREKGYHQLDASALAGEEHWERLNSVDPEDDLPGPIDVPVTYEDDSPLIVLPSPESDAAGLAMSLGRDARAELPARPDPSSYDLCDGCARALGCSDAVHMPEGSAAVLAVVTASERLRKARILLAAADRTSGASVLLTTAELEAELLAQERTGSFAARALVAAEVERHRLALEAAAAELTKVVHS